MAAQDLEQVVALAAQLGYPNTLADLTLRFAAIECTPDYALFVAKEEDGGVLGNIQITAEPLTLLAGPRAEGAALVGEARARGRRIGAQLLERAESWAGERRLPLIRVRSNVAREDAHRFYRRHGYATNKTSHVFTKVLEC